MPSAYVLLSKAQRWYFQADVLTVWTEDRDYKIVLSGLGSVDEFFLLSSQKLSQVIGHHPLVFSLGTSSIVPSGITLVQHFNGDAVDCSTGSKADRALLCFTFVPHCYPAAPEPDRDVDLAEQVLAQDKSSCI